jgi:hypothetical protein
MSEMTRRAFGRRNVATATASGAALVTPAAAMATGGELSGAAIPVALLLGVFLLAVAWYFASAGALVEPRKRTTVVRRTVASPAASGPC